MALPVFFRSCWTHRCTLFHPVDSLSAGLQRPWRKHVVLTRNQITALAWNGASIAVFVFGMLYLAKICGPIRYVCSLPTAQPPRVHPVSRPR